MISVSRIGKCWNKSGNWAKRHVDLVSSGQACAFVLKMKALKYPGTGKPVWLVNDVM